MEDDCTCLSTPDWSRNVLKDSALSKNRPVDPIGGGINDDDELDDDCDVDVVRAIYFNAMNVVTLFTYANNAKGIKSLALGSP
jgi:hypothetical protein